jgi:hypothetical protein
MAAGVAFLAVKSYDRRVLKKCARFAEVEAPADPFIRLTR